MLDDVVPQARWGNRTSVEIEAPAPAVWEALEHLTVRELHMTRALLAARSLPALVTRKGALSRTGRREGGPRSNRLIDALAGGRFRILHAEPGRPLVLGTIGQFWKLSGGDTVDFVDRSGFEAFDEPGFVKAAIDFAVESAGDQTVLSTVTRNQATRQPARTQPGRSDATGGCWAGAAR